MLMISNLFNFLILSVLYCGSQFATVSTDFIPSNVVLEPFPMCSIGTSNELELLEELESRVIPKCGKTCFSVSSTPEVDEYKELIQSFGGILKESSRERNQLYRTFAYPESREHQLRVQRIFEDLVQKLEALEKEVEYMSNR